MGECLKVQQSDPGKTEINYDTPVPEFEITQMTIINNSEAKVNTESIQILLVLEGEISIAWDSQSQVYKKGQSILIPACLGNYVIKSERESTVFKVQVPHKE